VSEQADGELRDVCRRACDRAASEQGAEAVDWEAWYRRVDVEHDVAGIFPDIFFHYDANPDAARRILRAALAPDLSEPLYRHRIGESQILDFLAAKQAIDDELSRYCVNVILTREGNPDSHLALLKSNLAFPALRESLWQILERRAGASPILMRELLVLAHGDEDQVARLLRERLFAQTSPARAAPYLALLAGNLAWPPAAADPARRAAATASARRAHARHGRRRAAHAGRDGCRSASARTGLADE
jgi:hypothetical protein